MHTHEVSYVGCWNGSVYSLLDGVCNVTPVMTELFCYLEASRMEIRVNCEVFPISRLASFLNQ